MLFAAFSVLRSSVFPLFPAAQLLLALPWLGSAAWDLAGRSKLTGSRIGLGVAIALSIAFGNWWLPELSALFGLAYGGYLIVSKKHGWPLVIGAGAGLSGRMFGAHSVKPIIERTPWELAGVLTIAVLALIIARRRSNSAQQSITPR